MATCQGRVYGTPRQIQGTNLTAYTPKECGKQSRVQIPVDNGEAMMPLCIACSKRYQLRDNPACPWLGFFDCDIPPHSHVVGSAWYREAVKEGALVSAVASLKIDAAAAKE
jgi:hypothetical protein